MDYSLCIFYILLFHVAVGDEEPLEGAEEDESPRVSKVCLCLGLIALGSIYTTVYILEQFTC